MTNNISLFNTSRVGCNTNLETVHEARFYLDIVTSVTSFLGNIVLIMAVFQMRTRRTTTDYLVVNMAISDVFVPTMHLLYDILAIRKDAGYLSQQAFGISFCNLFFFLEGVSYGVSMISLVIITVIRFYAVSFPMRARIQSRLRTRVLFLSLTWVVPIATFSQSLFLSYFFSEHQSCSFELTIHQLGTYHTFQMSFYFFFPLLVMFVLYPVIIVKLRRQKIPGNANCPRALTRRRKQNIHLTTMFVAITVVFMLTWGIRQIMFCTNLFSIERDWCTFYKVYLIVGGLPNVFHATNPLIYFVFLSSYRQGIKQILPGCRHTHVHHAPGGDQIELGNIQQA